MGCDQASYEVLAAWGTQHESNPEACCKLFTALCACCGLCAVRFMCCVLCAVCYVLCAVCLEMSIVLSVPHLLTVVNLMLHAHPRLMRGAVVLRCSDDDVTTVI